LIQWFLSLILLRIQLIQIMHMFRFWDNKTSIKWLIFAFWHLKTCHLKNSTFLVFSYIWYYFEIFYLRFFGFLYGFNLLFELFSNLMNKVFLNDCPNCWPPTETPKKLCSKVWINLCGLFKNSQSSYKRKEFHWLKLFNI
jgi:hypothetical protein